MQFIADFWWLWIIGAIVSTYVSMNFEYRVRLNGWNQMFAVPALVFWFVFFISVIANFIDYAAIKFV